MAEPVGSLVSRETYDDNAVRTQSRTYHFDGLGSTVALTDETGAITDRYTYDEWGSVTPDANNQTLDNPYQYVGRYGYYTHYQEPDSGLLQLGVRYYDPTVGRFTQTDSVRSVFRPDWAYCRNNPLTLIDPSGRTGMNAYPHLDDKTGEASCTCKVDMMPGDLPSGWIDAAQQLAGMGTKLEGPKVTFTVPHSLGKCKKVGWCWFRQTAKKKKKEDHDRRNRGYKKCLKNECRCLCDFNAGVSADEPAPVLKELLTKWRLSVDSCYGKWCK